MPRVLCDRFELAFPARRVNFCGLTWTEGLSEALGGVGLRSRGDLHKPRTIVAAREAVGDSIARAIRA